MAFKIFGLTFGKTTVATPVCSASNVQIIHMSFDEQVKNAQAFFEGCERGVEAKAVDVKRFAGKGIMQIPFLQDFNEYYGFYEQAGQDLKQLAGKTVNIRSKESFLASIALLVVGLGAVAWTQFRGKVDQQA